MSGFETKTLERAYVAWIEALSSELSKPQNGKSSLSRALVDRLNRGISIYHNGYIDPAKFANTVRTWKKPGRWTLPSEYPRKIMVELDLLISEHLKTPPSGTIEGMNFSTTVSLIREARNANQPNARKENYKLSLYENGIVNFPVTKVRDVNLKELNLGSWFCGGEIPAYVPRKVDEEIRQRLNDSENSFFNLIGEPKSGKTRTLIELLRHSSLADYEIYFLSSRRGSIDLLCKAISKTSNKNIFFLDDLQSFSFSNEGGLTWPKIAYLLERGKVLTTLHSREFSKWQTFAKNLQTQRFNANISISENFSYRAADDPSPKLTKEIVASKVVLPVMLDDDEQVEAKEILNSPALTEESFQHLAAFMASVDVLKMELEILRLEGPIGAAAFHALVDSRIIHPKGLTLDTFRTFIVTRLTSAGVAIPTRNNDVDQAIIAFTSGVNNQAPHSILMRSAQERDKYVLLDALWDEIKPKTWEVPPMAEFSQEKYLEISHSARTQDYLETSSRILENLVAGDFLPAFSGLALHQFRNGKQSAAKKTLKRGIKLGDIRCKANLAWILLCEGQNEAAQVLYSEAAIENDSMAMNNLGVIRERQGKLEEAEDLYRQAAQQKQPKAIHNLGQLLFRREEYREAKKLFEEAADLGDAEGMVALAHMYMNQGDLQLAENFFRRATNAGEDSRMSIAQVAYLKGNVEEAEKIVRLASNDMDLEFSNNLALLLIVKGEYAEAESILTNLVKNKDPIAMQNLGHLMEKNGRLAEAEKYLKRAISHGNIRAAYNLASLAENRDDLASAEKYYRLLAVDPRGFFELGKFLERVQNFEEAEAMLYRAQKYPDPEFRKAYGALLYRRDRWDEAKVQLLESANLGDEMSIEILGWIAKESNDLKGAQYWYKRGDALNYAESTYWLAVTYWWQGAIPRAERLLARAIKLGSLEALSAFANSVDARDKNYKAAIKKINLLIESGYEGAIGNLAYVLEQSGDFESAAREYKIAVSSGDKVAALNYANFLLASGNVREAEKMFKLADVKKSKSVSKSSSEDVNRGASLNLRSDLDESKTSRSLKNSEALLSQANIITKASQKAQGSTRSKSTRFL